MTETPKGTGRTGRTTTRRRTTPTGGGGRAKAPAEPAATAAVGRGGARRTRRRAADASGAVRALLVTAELYPLVTTGGLADVSGALPPALAEQGIDVRVLVPGYPAVLDGLADKAEAARVPDLFGDVGRLVEGRLDDGTAVLAIDAPHLYDRPGNPYVDAQGRDWPDNHRRFAALGWVAARLAGEDSGYGWRPDVVHGHDWQAGLAPAYLSLRTGGGAHPATVMTIHNLAYQGQFPGSLLPELRLPAGSFRADGVEYYNQIGFLKAGLFYADRITTVSPTYAREIQRAEQGYGLEGLLAARAASLSGIMNGVDELVWNPATDERLAATYDADGAEAGKAANKAALQARLGLEAEPGAPLFCVIGPLTYRKGLDLLLQALPALLGRGARLALLGGTGDRELEGGFRVAAGHFPGRVAAVTGYDEDLAHLLQGGADAIVVPSRSEPCGLTQLCGLRYGTLPVVNRVGGLADSIVDANEAALADGVATGFVFAPPTADALADALARALDLYAAPDRWRAARRRAMTREVGWSAAAARYAGLYRELVAAVGHSYASVKVER